MGPKPSHQNESTSTYLPISNWIRRYDRSWLRPDLLAGITVAAVIIPEGMAYASLAGLPAETGLYASFFAVSTYLFVGTSRQVIYGPTSALAILLATQIGGITASASPSRYAALIALTTLLVGGIAIVAWLFRLGFVVNFISESVLTGFSTGAALFIISTQLEALVGITGATGPFYERLWFVLTHLTSIHPLTAAVGVGGIVLLLLGKRYLPRVPTAIVVVLLSIVFVPMVNLGSRGVGVVGPIPSGLPSPVVPPLAPSLVLRLLPVALALFLLSYVEGMGAVETFAQRNRYRADANQELLATGVMNIAAGLGQGFTVGGSMSRSALNDAVGARTPLTNGIVAVILVVVLVFLTEVFTNLPKTILAAIVIVAVTDLIDVSALQRLYRVDILEFTTAIAALGGVLVFGILYGLFIGVLVSLLAVVGRATYPHTAELGRVPDSDAFSDLSRRPSNSRISGVLVYRVNAELFFANVPTVRSDLIAKINDHPSPIDLVVFDLRSSPTVDLTAADMLLTLYEDLAMRDIDFRLAEADGTVRDVLTAARPDHPLCETALNERVITVIEGWQNENRTE
ncbi:SulP family inorganic anion transporter [Halocatena pleomorpha]|uniref:SulP family inorganic anion transporter n=1 Tax=Halocatena pleomorpha TaxID=1785090 RepID=A0A3P3RMD4_9EURY|nr:SulP family inorganic anion transporter [Halocatena pleomorpha]RRJ33999.1 SulP family inorganic anion transporter [Halocatena pleomorpha]